MMKEQYSGAIGMSIPNCLKYPQQKSYGPADSHLKDMCKKLRLSNNRDMRHVTICLDEIGRTFIETDQGNENALRTIFMQLHTSCQYRVDMLCHQLAEFLVQFTDFFASKMKTYLKAHNLTYSAYMFAVYNGQIWCDEFIIGVIGRMFNIRISIVSPYHTGMWHVFHDCDDEPDVVLVANGRDFGSVKDPITHLTATRGKGDTWQCVGSDQKLKAVETYTGFTEGKMMAIDFNNVNQSQSLLKQGKCILTDINGLCEDIKRICVKRDEIIEKLGTLNIEVGDFHKLTSYFVTEQMSATATTTDMPTTKRKFAMFRAPNRPIPKVCLKDVRTTELGEEIMREMIAEMSQNQEAQETSQPQTSNVQETFRPQRSDVQETFRPQRSDVQPELGRK